MPCRFLSFARCRFLIVALLIVALWPAGCSDNATEHPAAKTTASAEAPKPPPPPVPLPAEPAPAPAASPPATAPAPEPAPAAPQPTPQPQPVSPSPSGGTATERPIQLSRGQALEQTTVEGNAVGFSAEYEFTNGGPDSSAYVWVIERARGKPERRKVNLNRQGNLVTDPLILGWRSEDGPFHSHLEDANGNQVSESIEMPFSGG